MTYQVKLDPSVRKFLDKSDHQVRERLEKRLHVLKTDSPFHFLEHIEGEEGYKFRLGEYRALVDVDIQRQIIFVRVLDHRSRIYKQL